MFDWVTKRLNPLRRPHSRLFGYLLAFGAVVSAFLITIAVIVAFGPYPSPFISFAYLLAILIASWWGGYGPGLVACLLCYTVVPYVLIPKYTLSSLALTRFILTILVSLLVSRLAASRNREREAMAAANDMLERTVEERTAQLTQERYRYQALASHLMKMQESERLNLSRELHDSFGQELTALRYALDGLRRRVPAESDAIEALITSVQRLTSEVRGVASRLRPPVLDHLDLSESLAWLSEQWQERTGLDCTANIENGLPTISDSQKLAVFRICQEALTNVARHSEASQVSVSLSFGARLTLKVEDNGRGFDVGQHTESLGLLGMRERAEGIGGLLEIQSSPGNGTGVVLTIPTSALQLSGATPAPAPQ